MSAQTAAGVPAGNDFRVALGLSNPGRVRWYPSDVLAGMITLTALEECAFRRLLDMIFMSGDQLPDDDRLMRVATKAGRHWPAVKQRLTDLGKIEVVDGFIRTSFEWSPMSEPAVRRTLDVSGKEWRRLRVAVFERDGYACFYCGAQPESLDCDHVVPFSRGGASEMRNLVAACEPCNRSKGARTPSEWMGGRS